MSGNGITEPRMPYWQAPQHPTLHPTPATGGAPVHAPPASSATGSPGPATPAPSQLPAWLTETGSGPYAPPGSQYVPNFSEDAAALGLGGSGGSPRLHELAIAAAIAVAITAGVHLWRKHHHHAG